MKRKRRQGIPAFRGNHLALIVLLTGLCLSGFLVYEVFRAQRMQDAAVERGVQNVRFFVTDRVQAVVAGNWGTAAFSAFAPLRDIDGITVTGPLPSPTLLDPAALVGGNFGKPLAPEGAARIALDLRGGYPVLLESESSQEVAEHLSAQIRHTLASPKLEEEEIRTRPLIYDVIFLDMAPTPRAAFLAYLRDGEGGIHSAFGFVTEASHFFDASLDGVLDIDARWLAGPFREPPHSPPLLSVGIENSSSGRVLAHTGEKSEIPDGVAPTSTALPFYFPQDGLHLRVALDPDFLQGIPFGAASRPPPLNYGILLLFNLFLVVAALTQLRKEREFVRKRTEFVAGFSHEARNPVATIRLYVQALRFRRVRGEAGAAAALDVIDRESRRLVHMVSNFLTFGASERETLTLVPRPIDLSSELPQFAENVRAEVESRQSQIQLDVPSPLWIEADRTALHQILRNLVENSLKYGPPGQTIRIEAAARGSGVLIAVEDGGPGIPPSEREDVFEPFVRTPAGIRSGAGGSGLGLSIVRDLAHLHGGSVHAESGESGEGLRISITLPPLTRHPTDN